ncbi:MAG: alpha-ketoglutarate dehydrogenase [Gammaproteobacteria bacterium]|nr:alpha-ketoglutarate dehydrogenase [Gammaproteobacteria bacterium]
MVATPQEHADEHEDFREEEQEWLEAFADVVARLGPDAANRLLGSLEEKARDLDVLHQPLPYSPYRNTVSVEHQPPYPGNIRIEERTTAILRWNALVMVMRANQAYGELGGHVASYASAAEIFEIGFNHFFRGGAQGDLVYFQPHSAPGVYARALLEGRLNPSQLAHYRQEVTGEGLCSYPHPWLMPEFWQFPTGSMGIGPISAVYNARFMRYLAHRDILDTEQRHVWGIFGDGEMDEPESLAALPLAARENLDNLTFVINCNLQRLDGPVRGNGQIIQELESTFRGAGWNVIKVLWASEWDALFSRDTNHALLRKFSETVDGKYQTLGAMDGAYNLKNFFNEDPELAALVSHMSDDDIDGLRRGGHDFKKLYAAFEAARQCKDRPTVILAKTKKGFGMGAAGESRMTAHQAKKLDLDALKQYRDRFNLPLSDSDLEKPRFLQPDDHQEEVSYLLERRAALGGFLPERSRSAPSVQTPALDEFAAFALQANDKEMSTTMAFVRLLSALLKHEQLGSRLVPIVADEARTFGMASLFRQVGIYAPSGQLYEPEDAGSMLAYRESRDGQLLEEGITEAGAMASWTAAATAYSTHGVAMLPVYIYYSMFGFQRVGDLIWAAADQRARGFLIGATAGRTTLSGEGLQHQDGSSHVIAATIPTCRAYDPCFAYELAVIVDRGARRMMTDGCDEFYYITVGNENYAQPTCPSDVNDAIVKGLYQLSATTDDTVEADIRLLGSGPILREAIRAREILASRWDISSEVYSVTSFAELEREARAVERQRRHRPGGDIRPSHLETLLPGDTPLVAVSDYVRAYPQLISPYLTAPYYVLGTDGFGRSDTRVALRNFFEISAEHIVVTAIQALVEQGSLSGTLLTDAVNEYQLSQQGSAPWLG